MDSVQVRILRSGRTDVYGLPLVPGSVATVGRDYAVSLVSTGFASWMNPADAYGGDTRIPRSNETYVLFQTGVPFWIPPGDGGANGLSFTGTRGVFTLSAESPLANAWVYLAGGGYIYLPAGAGGLVSGGWYWCVMTGATAGEVYAETYSGFGRPARVTSPTALPNLTAARLTQLTSEISAVSFLLPGGSLGASGVYVSKARIVSNSSVGTKVLRLSISNATPTTRIWAMARTTTSLVGNLQFTGFAHGNRLIKSTSNGGSSEVWDNGNFSTVTTGDVLSVDLTVDQMITMSGQLPANTDSLLFVPGQFVIQYGE